MNAQQIINYIATAEKKTPVRIFVKEKEPIDYGSAKVFGISDKIVFGDWKELGPIIEANKDKIRDIVSDGFAELCRYYPTLTEEQAVQDGFICSLWKKYCFYAYNNAQAAFKENYADELLNLRQMYEVSVYESEQTDA